MKQLIVNADDSGICRSTNRAIAEGYRRGILTSTSLMVCGPAFEHALEQVVRPNPDLGVGLHVCLTNTRSILSPEEVPLLVDRRGRFRQGFVSLFRLTLTNRRSVMEQIEREIAAQFEVLETHGVPIDHVDSHRHVHMIPAIFETVTRLAHRYRCPAVRVCHEPIPRLGVLLRPSRLPLLAGNIAKKLVLSTLTVCNRRRTAGLYTPDRVVGVLDSGRMDLGTIQEAIASATDGVTEIITHPGEKDPDVHPDAHPMERTFLRSPGRFAEFAALVDPTIRELVERLGCSMVRYSNLAGEKQVELKRVGVV